MQFACPIYTLRHNKKQELTDNDINDNLPVIISYKSILQRFFMLVVPQIIDKSPVGIDF